MSKQFSQLPDEPEVPRGSNSRKKRKGDWEIWMKYNTIWAREWMRGWHLKRSYEKKQDALQNYKKLLRQFSYEYIQYQLRYKGQPIDIE